MRVFLLVVLVVHVAAGFVAMIGGLVPALVRKGGASHRRWGRVFTWAMFVVAATTFPLALWRSDAFQVVLGLLAGYAAFLGRRTGRPIPPTPQDAVLSGLGGAVFGGLIAIGPSFFVKGDPGTGRLALLFGLLGLGLALRDLQGILVKDRSVRRRIVDHILATTLGLVVAWSSFLNTQFLRLTGLRWPIDAKMVLPFAVAVPLVLFWVPRWNGRLKALGARAWAGGRESSETERLRAFGIAEGVSFLLLLFVAVPLKRIGGEPALVKFLGPVHGVLVVLYGVSVWLAASVSGWRWSRTLGTLAAAVVPFGTFYLEMRLRREASGAAA